MYMYIYVYLSIQIYLPMVKTGFKQITQGLLSETFVEAHVCRNLFVRLSVYACTSTCQYTNIYTCIYVLIAYNESEED